MKKLDLKIDISLFLIGIVICLVSLRLPYGRSVEPGPGFLPFWCGVLICIISLGLIFHHLYKLWKKVSGSEETKNIFQGVDSLKPSAIIGAMILYGLFFERLGFILSNFLFLVLIFRFVWRKGWGFILFASLLLTLSFWVVIEVLGKFPLPKGILIHLTSLLRFL